MFLDELSVLRLITTVWAKMSQNSYLQEFCAQVSQIVFLGDLTVLRPFTTVWAKNYTKLITPRVLCRSITKRVHSWFNRFTAYYNCMNKNVTKLISPRVLCTSVTNRVLSWFDLCYGLLLLYEQKCHKTHISASFLHKYHKIVFLAELTILQLNTTVWANMSQKNLCEFL